MLTQTPYPYQDKAIDKALDRGSLLIAYGMGLGKTLIQMGICEELLGDGEVTMNAIVVPASLKWQWAQALVWGTDVETREIRLKKRKITVPVLERCVVIDGTPEKRDKAYRFAREVRPDYIILGYENVVNDWRMVKRLHPELIAGDEITAIKSFGAERSQMFKEWDADYRYGLTGTPIDNRPEELFSIMEWIDPEPLGRWDLFDRSFIARDDYGRMKRAKNLDVLHRKTKTFSVRKTRFDPDVAKYMPKDQHKDEYVELTGKTRAMYNSVATELADALTDLTGFGGFDLGAYYSGEGSGFGSEEQGNAMARFSALSMLVDHPMLLLESAKQFDHDFTLERPKIMGSKYAWSLYKDGDLDWVNDKVKSPKFETALLRIRDVVDEHEKSKVIVFSFHKTMLHLFKARLSKMGIGSVIFEGSMGTAAREAAKMQFKTDPKTRVFLSSDAGGMGVDLPEANYLINYNHPWSAGKADQRNSRHIRAGSHWDEVFVLNYIVQDSVEEWKFSILERKRALADAIMDGGPTNKGVIAFDSNSLLDWLRNHRV